MICRDSLNQKRLAFTLVALMIFVPWSAMSTTDINFDKDESPYYSNGVWGAGGSNDTGWIDFVANGANPENGTYAYGDLNLNFAPGAIIDNFTFEVEVDGANGYWVTEPQITLLDTQTPILDWRDLGDLGRQNTFEENPPEVSENGVLDTWLQPNSVSDAGWQLPVGVTITDLVIEALRPADPKVSFSAQNIEIYDSAVNPIDGRLYILLDDDLIHLDDQASKPIIDINAEIFGRSLTIDSYSNRILIGTEDGSVYAQSLFSSEDLGVLLQGPSDVDDQSPITAIGVDSYGTVWAASGCQINYIALDQSAWSNSTFCLSDELEIPSDLVIVGDRVYLSTMMDGVHLLDYTTTSGSNGVNVTIDDNIVWDTQNHLTSDQITDLQLIGNHLLIATATNGINRRDLASNSWLASWSTGNWLASNQVHGLVVTDGWLHILADSTVHAYDTGAMIFRSQRQLSDMGLFSSGKNIIAWPDLDGARSPDIGTVLVSDGTGIVARLQGEATDGTEVLVSSPAADPMHVTLFVDDLEDGEIWIGGGNILDRFDRDEQIWQTSIDISDYVNNPGRITSMVQDSLGWVWVGTLNAGILRLDYRNGSYIGTVQGISSTHVSSLAHDDYTSTLVVGHTESGISLVNTSTMTLSDVLTESDGMDSDFINDVATRYGIAYIATPDSGVMRVDLQDLTILGSWQSLGADNLYATPVAVDEDMIYLGLNGLGILVFDRLTGDISDFWNEDGNLPDDDILSLKIDINGGLLVGASGALARWDGSSWTTFTTTGNWWQQPSSFYDVTSDSDGIYAGTNRGACYWNWQYQYQDCISTNDGMPSRWVYAVDMLSTDRLLAGTNEGAALINTDNNTVIEVWQAGDETQRSRTVLVDDILYLGFENTGIARYDLVNLEWLQTWDGDQGMIDDDDVTTLVPGLTYGTIWAGGDFGLTLLNVINNTVIIDWNRGSNSGGPTLSNTPPADIEIIGDTLHYSLQRGVGWWAQSNDLIYRINLTANSSKSILDAGSRLGWAGIVHGIGSVGDHLWIGVRPTQGNNGDGTIVRWNTSSENWSDDLQTIGNVLRVNAQFLGDCFPINSSSCEMWVAYGDNILRRFSAQNMTLLNEWTDIDGPIRGMVEYDGEYMFASMAGLLRWNPANETWLTPWTHNNGLPSDSEDEIYSLTVAGNDLWAGTYGGNWNSDAEILRMNGSSGLWSLWDLDTGDIPDGYPADIEVCDDIVHIAIGEIAWWGNQGGIARYDLADHDNDQLTNEWISPLTTGAIGLDDNDVRAIACDDSNRIMYIGFDTNGIGIGRYNYNTNSYLTTLTKASDGIGDDRVFPGGMLHDGNLLLIAHQYDGTGGVSRIITSGTSTASGQIMSPGMDGCSIVRAPSTTTPVYAIGRSGQTSGLNRVDRLDSTGLIESGFDELTGLTSGRIVEIISNSTHVWVSTSLSSNSFYGSSILQGELTSNGSVRWEFGYNFQSDIVNDLTLDGDVLWVTTAGQGLKKIDLLQRTRSNTPIPLHNQMDGTVLLDDGTMYVGLMGYDGSAAGFQIFNTNTGNWGHGSLIAGLPSNIVRDFMESGDHIFVATHGGIGLYNTTRNDWDDPITTIDGLPSPIIEHLMYVSDPNAGNITNTFGLYDKILAGGLAGLTVFNSSNLSIIETIGFDDGLAGDKVSGLAFADSVTREVVSNSSTVTLYHDASIFISHNGQGSTRPGVVAWDIVTDHVNGSYQIDMIPSNDVRAIATDDWGVHIATDTEPVVHWNSTMMKMETGVGANSLLSWPPFEMVSNGNELVLISPRGIDVLRVGGDHGTVDSLVMTGLAGATIDYTGLYVVGEDGLHHFNPVVTLNEQPRENQRRAEPLTALFAGQTWDITNRTHPGMTTTLVDNSNPITISSDVSSSPTGALPMHFAALTLASPSSGAYVWARSNILNYTGSWDLAARDHAIEAGFQNAISNIGPGSTNVELHVQLQSPADGQIRVRVTYDWERIEVPTSITSLVNRPNDGGGVLEASWLPSEDAAWHSYRLYVWDSTAEPDWEPSKSDLANFGGFLTIPYWSQTTTMITEADQGGLIVPLVDGNKYRVAIVIEYPDGSIGEPMSWVDNATPTDEIPAPPAWIYAEPISGGTAGTIFAEWTPCTELDRSKTRLWAVEHEITNAIALNGEIDYPFSSGNTTVIQLNPGIPYWFATVCVDEAGQSDPANATVIGPIVTAGGLNDGIPPEKIEDTIAIDVPDDEGGIIEVNWTPNDEEDCAYHTIYMVPATSWQPPNTVDGWPAAAYTGDCTTNSTLISSIGELSLVDDSSYWVGIVASDDWGNQNLNDVLVVEVTPQSNLTGAGIPPERVAGLNAWDHPDDDGTAVDIIWNRSLEKDFSFYTIWISEYPLNDLVELWELCEDDPVDCGLITIDQRQIGGAFQLEITLTTALYGNRVDNLVSQSIESGIPLYLTVTTHDISGNVHLDEMQDNMVLVTPLDNRGDIHPPVRLVAPHLTDRAPDDGDGMLVTFQESEDSDVAEYWIYADVVPFTSIGMREPAMIVTRDVQIPVLLEQLSDGRALAPSIMTWASVVAVDSSGNYWDDGLKTTSIALIDENSLDPGLHIPEVSGLRAYWNPSGDRIEIQWDDMQSPVIESYIIFVSAEPFEDTRDINSPKSGNEWQVVENYYTLFLVGENSGIVENWPVLNEISYYIAVVGFDGEVHRLAVDPLEVRPFSESAFGSENPGDDGLGLSWVDQLIGGDMNMIIAVVSAIMILIGAILIIKPKEQAAPEPWEMGALEVELEEEMNRRDAGLDEDDSFDEPIGFDASDQEISNVAEIDRGDAAEVGEINQETLGAQPIEFGDDPTPSASFGVTDELLGDDDEIDLDDLADMADDFDLDDVTDDLDDKDEDVDTSFLDDLL